MTPTCNKPCEGCAFTEGAEANTEPQNNLKAQLCLLGGIPFYCHHSKDGTLQDLSDIPRAKVREQVRIGRMVICQGWRREVAALAVKGYYREQLEAKRAFAAFGLGALQIFVSTEDKAEKRKAAKNLKDIILSLNRAQGFTEVMK